jgi:YebC/PmpR family DNA-binding regulatory protein
MSGHSKWANIHRKKEANDKVKGKVFTKMASLITVAVVKGGGIGDPEKNFALRLAVDKARGVNMPRENIDRAIEKGMGKGSSQSLAELTIEGFAPEGVMVVVEAVTDNRNRTVAELRTLMEKMGGRMGEPGSTMYQFERCGIIHYQGYLAEEVELSLIDLGMIDMNVDEEGGVVYTHPDALHAVQTELAKYPLTEIEGSLGYRPKSVTTVVARAAVENFLEAIADYDDTQEVYATLAE